jgi:hypothetical protein
MFYTNTLSHKATVISTQIQSSAIKKTGRKIKKFKDKTKKNKQILLA